MSSFRKRNVQKPIPGTRTSTKSGQVITSSGNPSLDLLLGGGLPIGSICLIEEDKYVTHSKVLAKYFLAEGVLSQQFVFLGSLDDDPTELLRKLPKPLNEVELQSEYAETAREEAAAPQNGLRIAWRYNDLPLVNSEQTSAKIGHHFNLLEHMDPLQLDFAETGTWSDDPQRSLMEEEDGDAVEHEAEADEEEEEEDEEENEKPEEEQHQQTKQMAGGGGEGGATVAALGVAASTDNKDDFDMENARNSIASAAASDKEVLLGDELGWMPVVPWCTQAKDRKENSLPSPAAAQKSHSMFTNAKYLRLLNEIQPLLREDKFTTAPGGALGGHKGLCRVCITSLGSPLWYKEVDFAKDLLKFLTVLRAAVRSSVAVCFVTMPMHLVAKFDESLVSKIRNLVDFAIELESFAGSERETNPAFKEYSGLLHLHRIAAINTLSAYTPETTDLAFKLRRKKFVIEKLHLPPELQENNNEAAAASASADVVSTNTLSCSSSGGGGGGVGGSKTSLDF